MATDQMTSEQFRALAQMDSVELGQLATMALMVVAVKTERDYVEVIRELADVVEVKHAGEEEQLRRAVEQAMAEHEAEPEPAAVQERDVPEGVEPPEISYTIRLRSGVWAMEPDAVFDLIEKSVADARDQLLEFYEVNRAQVRADFPRIVPAGTTTTDNDEEA